MRSEDYTEELREKHRKIQTKLWQDPEYCEMQSVSHSKKRGPRVVHINKICFYCGNTFSVAPWESYRKFCTLTCFGRYNSEYRVGSNAPNWKGGLSIINISVDTPYSIDFSERMKRLVRERDGYICKLCEMTESDSIDVFGRRLSVHHIDYDKDNASQWNLISLCCRCHARVNYNREHWLKLFTSFVQQNVNKRKIIDLDLMILRKPRQWMWQKVYATEERKPRVWE